MLSIDSGFAKDHDCPEPYLREIAGAGFTHTHWCHHWGSDFLYSQAEIDQIRCWLQAFGLRLLGVHASAGHEKCWTSPLEYERLAGVQLVQNRIDMAARLGSDVVVMHIMNLSESALADERWVQLLKSLDTLQPYARERGVRIALENTSDHSVARIQQLFALYGPEYVGLCYDCGHGNLSGKGLDQLEVLKERLIAVHLHDNDGSGDQHKIPFTGTVDWPRLAGIMARSAYRECVSIESNMRCFGSDDERAFLQQAYAAGVKLAHMVDLTGL